MKKFISFCVLAISLSALAGSEMYPLSESSCQNEYLALFNKDVIEVTAAFGYDDIDESLINDQNSLALFLKTLTTPCARWDQKICGFSVRSERPYVLTKKIIGPDGNSKVLKIITDAPSLSTDAKANLKNPLQRSSSARVKEMFLNGLKTSDVILYMGHSRDGGGPDFEPAKLNSSGHVNYGWYHKHPYNKQTMIKALGETPRRPRILALLSCNSVRWFSRGVFERAPSTGIVGTNESFYTSKFEQSVPLLEKIFSFQCLQNFTIDDMYKKSKIVTKKIWEVSGPYQQISLKNWEQETLENLANLLHSTDVLTRAAAYKEIQNFDSKLYTKKVWEELNHYRFALEIGKNF